MKKKSVCFIAFWVLLLMSVSFGLEDYELDKKLNHGLGNWNHFGLAYNPSSNHLFLGRGSDGLGFLTEIDMIGNVINNQQVGIGTYSLCHAMDLSYDLSSGHLFALMSTGKDGVYNHHIWEMSLDLQTIYSDFTLQEILHETSFIHADGLHVNDRGIWITRVDTDEIIHLSRDYRYLGSAPTPDDLSTIAASPDGGFLSLKFAIFGDRYIYEFDQDLNHIATTDDIYSAFGIPNSVKSIETYQNKLFLSTNTTIYELSYPIPEPCTLLLLGLGGLTLRLRRSR